MLKDQNVSVVIGDYMLLSFTLYDFDNGLKPLDLTGASLAWDVLQGRYKTSLLSKNMGSGDITITDTIGGKATVRMTSEDTNRLRIGEEYSHYLRLIDATGQVTTLATGKIVPE